MSVPGLLPVVPPTTADRHHPLVLYLDQYSVNALPVMSVPGPRRMVERAALTSQRFQCLAGHVSPGTSKRLCVGKGGSSTAFPCGAQKSRPPSGTVQRCECFEGYVRP